MQAYNLMDFVDSYQIFLGNVKFLYVCLGGSFIGILTGVLSAVITRFTEGITAVQPIILFMTAYLGYILSEIFELSGIVSMVFCGLLQVHYSFGNISYKSQITVRHLTHVVASMSEIMIFMFLGLELVATYHSWNTGFVAWSMLLCTISRFLCCFGMCMLINFFDKSRIQLIGYTEMFMISFGGLRGAVAFSLAALLNEDDLPMKQMFVTTTLFIVMFTVFVQGCTIKPLVHLLQINLMTEKTETIFLEIHSHVADHLLAGIEAIMGLRGTNHLRETLNALDFKYIRKYMMNNPQEDDAQIMDVYNKIVVRDHYTKTEDGEWAPTPKDHLKRQSLVSGDYVAADSDIRLKQGMKQIHDLYTLRSALIGRKPTQIVRGSDNIAYRRNSLFTRLRSTSRPLSRSTTFSILEEPEKVIGVYEEEEPLPMPFFSSILQAVKKTIASPEVEGPEKEKFVSCEVQTDLTLLDFSILDMLDRDEYWQGVLKPLQDIQKDLKTLALESEGDKINTLAVKSPADIKAGSAPTTELDVVPVAAKVGQLKSQTALEDIQGEMDDTQGSGKLAPPGVETNIDVFPDILGREPQQEQDRLLTSGCPLVDHEHSAGILAQEPKIPLLSQLMAESVPQSPATGVLPETQVQGLSSMQSQQVYEKPPTNKPSAETEIKEVEERSSTALKKLQTQQSGSEKTQTPQEYVSVLIPESTPTTAKEASPLETEKEKNGMLLDAEKVDKGKLPAGNEQAPKPPSEIAHSSTYASSAEPEMTAAPPLNVTEPESSQKEASKINTPNRPEDDAEMEKDPTGREALKTAEEETSTVKSSNRTNMLGWFRKKKPMQLVNQQGSEPAPAMDASLPLKTTNASMPDPGPKPAAASPPVPSVEREQEAVVSNLDVPGVSPRSEVPLLPPQSTDHSDLKSAQKQPYRFLGFLGKTLSWSQSKSSVTSYDLSSDDENKDKPKNN